MTLKRGLSAKRSVHAVAAAAAVRPSGFSVPQIRLVTVAPPPGESLRALAARLPADPRVASVAPERRGAVRFQSNDPALYTLETAKETAPGTYVEWWAARSGFIQAWDISQGAGATVAVIDTGAEISHPDLAPSVAELQTFDAAQSPAGLDTIGPGTHVASLACAAGNNGVGLAGAGLGSRLLIVKSDFSDSSVAASVVWAVDHHADAINMSFGTAPARRRRSRCSTRSTTPSPRGVVLVAAAADDPIEHQATPRVRCSRPAPGRTSTSARAVGHRRRLPGPPGAVRRARLADLARRLRRVRGRPRQGPARDLRRVHVGAERP